MTIIRKQIGLYFLVAALILFAGKTNFAQDYTKFVNPFIGTKNTGHIFYVRFEKYIAFEIPMGADTSGLKGSFRKPMYELIVVLSDNFNASFKSQPKFGVMPQRPHRCGTCPPQSLQNRHNIGCKNATCRNATGQVNTTLNLFKIRACDDLFAFVSRFWHHPCLDDRSA